MTIELTSHAQDDLVAGYRFYAEQLESVGEYFLDSLYSDIDSLVVHAGIHPVIFGYHRMLAQRFPFAIYYKLDKERVQVYRVLDCRQNPSRISRQLRNS
ncbi:MAG TPA: hypothetical protein PKM44_10155 [Turneriella sp.]|nr:hypothetical protein [Turneriella sp.]